MSKFLKISVMIVLLASTLLAGCQAATPAPTAEAPVAEAPVVTVIVPAEPQVTEVVVTEVVEVQATEVPVTTHYKFAWIMPDMFNPFWVYMRQGAEKAAQELRQQGIQVDIQQMAPIQTFNVEEQVAIFENAIQMKVDAVGICVIDQNAVIDQVNKAVEAGIPVAALSTDIPNSKRTVFAGQDNKVVAQTAADAAIKKNEGKGNYIILSGIAGNYISEERDAGYAAAIAAYPDAKLLDKQPSNFNRKDGMSVMENMLQKYGPGEIQGVFTVNDEAALGALQAIQAAGRESEITLVGIDGNEDAANAIKTGVMFETAADDPWMKGYVAVYNLVYKLMGDAKFEENPTVEVTYVTADNVDKYLENFAYWAQFYKP